MLLRWAGWAHAWCTWQSTQDGANCKMDVGACSPLTTTRYGSEECNQ
jgi:hypothetical protein